MLSKLNLEDFKVWLTEQDGRVFFPGDIHNCPVAQYASARSGKDCWASYDQIIKCEFPMKEDSVILQDSWILEVIKKVDASSARQLSAKEVLALL